MAALWIGLLAVSAPKNAEAVTLAGGVTAGGAQTCAVTGAGSAQCWGWNYYGQLGVGTDTGPQVCALADEEYPIGCSTVPVTVDGLGNGVKAITAGYAHTCALTTAGGVRCWGYNAGGQLGNGTNTGPEECGQFPVPCSTVPVAVSGLGSGIAAIDAGWNHTCALTGTGGVECWGANSFGQLGDGTTTDRSTPVAVELPGDATATAVAAGGHHTCAVTSTGGIECWGMNRFGQLGNGTDNGPEKCGDDEYACSTTPVSVQLPSGVTATSIAIGDESTCALTSTGEVLCWGYNSDGQLGDGTTIDSSTPVAVQLPEGVAATAISGFAYYFCGLTSADGVECWGENNSGQLGDGTTASSSIPVAVKGLRSGATAVAAGWDHACAATDIGGIECWGDNLLGSLGTGDKQFHSTPTPVKGLSGARTLSVSVDGAGSGAITSSPPGIDCGAGHGSCSASFAAGSAVQLHADAEPGSAFSKFSGEGCDKGGSTCLVTMSSDRSVSATFALPPLVSIASPADGRTYTFGEIVPTSFSCAEGASGPGLLSCNDSNGIKTTSGGAGNLNTSTVGFHAYTVTVVSKDGLADNASIGYRVLSPTEPKPPEPEPPTPSAPRVSIRSGSALIAQGRTKVWLSCTGGTATSVCRGRLSLVSRTPLGRRFRPTSYKGNVFGNARYAIPTGESKFVGLPLRKALLLMMERASRHRLRVTTLATEESGPTVSRSVVLRLAKR